MKLSKAIEKLNKSFQPSEHQIQMAISNYLQMRRWYVMRLNSGRYAIGEGVHKRFIRGQAAGTPDLLAIRDGKCLFIEVKRPGGDVTLLQERMMEELRGYGAECLVIHSVEELQEMGI